MQGLIDRGEKDGVAFNEEEYRRSYPILCAIVKGLVGRDIFEQSTYSRIVLPLTRFSPTQWRSSVLPNSTTLICSHPQNKMLLTKHKPVPPTFI